MKARRFITARVEFQSSYSRDLTIKEGGAGPFWVQNLKSAASLDDLVGAGKQRRGHGEAKRLGRLEVVLYRQIARLLALQNAIGIGRSLPHQADEIGTVGH